MPAEFVEDPLVIQRLDWLTEIRKDGVSGSWLTAANRLLDGLKRSQRIPSQEVARKIVEDYYVEMLNLDRYLDACTLAYHKGMFNGRPLHVQRIFHTLTNWDLVILVGAGDLGKSLNAAVWMAQDWRRDPENTAIKYASVTDTNLKSNLWAKMLRYQDDNIFFVEHENNPTRMRIWKKGCKDRPDSGIDAVLLGTGNEARGKLKGYHPQPYRETEHPIWGHLTRIRMLLDEGQHIAPGVEKDLGSPMTSVDPETHVMKIVITANLTDETAWAVQKAAPKGGWREEYMDSMWDWDTEAGWRVCRVDTRQTENVKQRREVFPGFPKYGGERKFMNGTVPTSDLFVMWNGWVVLGRSADVVVPPAWFDQAIGEPIFVGRVVNIAGFDPAYDRDKAVLAIGRYGLASGWLGFDGTVHQFQSRVSDNGSSERRHCCVLDQQIHLSSKDPVGLAKEIRAWCEKAGVTPENLAGDKTGNGVGTTGHLTAYWSKIISINAKQGASAYRILAEDTEGADIQCRTATDEMYYTVRRWIPQTVRGFFINPVADHIDILKHELTTRGWKHGTANQFEVEPKEKYVKRGNQSPGFSDALGHMVLVPRLRGMQLPAMVDEQVVAKKRNPNGSPKHPDQVSYATASIGGNVRWTKPELNGGDVVVPSDWNLKLR